MTADDNLRDSLKASLADYPALRAWIPARRLESNDITSAQMSHYDARRLSRYFHHLNLPLLLHGALFAPDPTLRTLLRSVLKTLNDFCDRFRDTPRARGFLAPLWKNMWTDVPELWSIVSGTYMALSWQANGFPVIAFESRISDNEADEARDDITIVVAGATAHVEIEAWHAAQINGLDDQALRSALLERADRKASKFSHLPPARRGIVAVVCVIADGDEDRRLDLPIAHIPGRAANVGWCAYRLVGLHRGEDYRFGVVPFGVGLGVA